MGQGPTRPPGKAVPIGIDVAKVTLDVWVESASTGWTVSNDERGIAELVERVQAYEAGRWGEVGELSTNTGTVAENLPDLYLQAVNWARERLEDPEF